LRYVSTRGAAPALGFEDVLLAGLAPDGGLYLPETWPRLSAADLKMAASAPYAETAARVLAPFVGAAVAPADLARLCAESYAGFDHPAVAPLVQLDRGLWLLELFHGPTLAFKDLAMQLLGRLYDHVLRRRGQRIVVVAATSGDTGSAAIEACRGRESIALYVLHPLGRVSEVQRRQMTTVTDANIRNIAVEGSFDDCQDLLKGLFADEPFRREMRLSAVNSINWARIAAQVVYYVTAAAALGAPERAVSFAVPTGNFGNAYAAYAARAMGLPVERLVVASNRNDILARFFASGELAIGAVEPSLSPSMDIQVSSNFERLLFDLYDRDGAAVAGAMAGLRRDGRLLVGEGRWRRATEIFSGFRLDDPGTLMAIKQVHDATGSLIDPHSAVAVAAAKAALTSGAAAPMVVLATAHPAKFPDTVERATGRRPELPAHLAGLMQRPERVQVLPNDLAAVRDFIAGIEGGRGRA
jgi:threonine synthase